MGGNSITLVFLVATVSPLQNTLIRAGLEPLIFLPPSCSDYRCVTMPGSQDIVKSRMSFLPDVYTDSVVEAAGVWAGYTRHPGLLFPTQCCPSTELEGVARNLMTLCFLPA